MRIFWGEWNFWSIVIGLVVTILIFLPFLFLLRKTLLLMNRNNQKLPSRSIWFLIFPYVGPFYLLFLTIRFSRSVDMEMQDRGIVRNTYFLRATGILHALLSIYVIFFSPGMIVGIIAISSFIMFWVEVKRIYKLLVANDKNKD